MTFTRTFADVEGGLRSWLRAQSGVSSVVGTRVFFGIPRDEAGQPSAAFPLIVLNRVGGAPQTGGAPLDDALIQLDCWGGISNKAQAWAAAKAVMDALESMTPQTLAAGVYAYGASVESVIWLPNPDDDRARYVVTAMVTARAA